MQIRAKACKNAQQSAKNSTLWENAQKMYKKCMQNQKQYKLYKKLAQTASEASETCCISA